MTEQSKTDDIFVLDEETIALLQNCAGIGGEDVRESDLATANDFRWLVQAQDFAETLKMGKTARKRFFSYYAGVRSASTRTSSRQTNSRANISKRVRSPEPDPAGMLKHLQFITASARNTYSDALIEIAYNPPRTDAVSMARLFDISDQGLLEAVEFAVAQNKRGSNIYVGGALRNPAANRLKRCSGNDFYVGTCVFVDIDDNHLETLAALKATATPGMSVRTGSIPSDRSQHWLRLAVPCDDFERYEDATRGLCDHIGSDPKACNGPSRVMRLGGSISFPKKRKITKGYETELTLPTINSAAEPVTVEAMAVLPKLLKTYTVPPQHSQKIENQPATSIIVDETGCVIDGRETYARDLVLYEIQKYQETHEVDPTENQVFLAVTAIFYNPQRVDHSDKLWTTRNGRSKLFNSVHRTMRRFRSGELSRYGFEPIDHSAQTDAKSDQSDHDSINTGFKKSSQADDQADILHQSNVSAQADAAQDDHAYDRRDESEKSSSFDVTEPYVYDPFAPTPVPVFPFDVLPETIQRYVKGQSAMIGCDPSALAMCVLAAFAGAISADTKIQPMRTSDWQESPNIWVMLIGDPSTMKSPMMRAAMKPLELSERDLRNASQVQHEEWKKRKEEAAAAKTKFEEEEPQPSTRLMAGDATYEMLVQLLARSNRGITIVRDEIAALLDGFGSYGSHGSSQARGFYLQSWSGGSYTNDRKGTGKRGEETFIQNCALTIIGGIQPDRLDDFSDTLDDGLFQRFLPVYVGDSHHPREIVEDIGRNFYIDLVKRCVHMESCLVLLSPEAYTILDELRQRILALEKASVGLARGFPAFVGKLKGYSARLALILHVIENPETAGQRLVSADTALSVARIIEDFILQHGLAVYRGTGGGKGDILREMASYILTAHDEVGNPKRAFVVSDFKKNVASVKKNRGLTVKQIVEMVSPLVAIGWLVEATEDSRGGRGKRPKAEWTIAPGVLAAMASRRVEEERRKAALARLMNSSRRSGTK